MEHNHRHAPTFGPFIETLREYGVGKTTGYALLNADLIKTFLIGRKRYVYHDSIRSLPERLAANEGGDSPQAAAK